MFSFFKRNKKPEQPIKDVDRLIDVVTQYGDRIKNLYDSGTLAVVEVFKLGDITLTHYNLPSSYRGNYYILESPNSKIQFTYNQFKLAPGAMKIEVRPELKILNGSFEEIEEEINNIIDTFVF